MKEFEQLLDIAKRKSKFDRSNTWAKGSSTYLAEIKKELAEVADEIPRNRICFLEDELGDVLWDYLNILCALESETGVKVISVLKRACKKYEERISGIENGELWKDIKQRQKVALANEQTKIGT